MEKEMSAGGIVERGSRNLPGPAPGGYINATLGETCPHWKDMAGLPGHVLRPTQLAENGSQVCSERLSCPARFPQRLNGDNACRRKCGLHPPRGSRL